MMVSLLYYLESCNGENSLKVYMIYTVSVLPNLSTQKVPEQRRNDSTERKNGLSKNLRRVARLA